MIGPHTSWTCTEEVSTRMHLKDIVFLDEESASAGSGMDLNSRGVEGLTLP